ncbi:MAG: acetoacetate--CoA ligase [Gammaproteobacteria bacterium]|nr:acetoacetate--CoA ligase [Gammaproteobacteria bacterium]
MTPKIMWQPSKEFQAATEMNHFMAIVNSSFNLSLSCYADLYDWSISHKAFFWKALWDFFSIQAGKPADKIFVPGNSMWDCNWFEGATLNFAENLMRRRDDKIAIVFNNEKNQRKTLSYSQLYTAVAKTAAYFKKLGIKKDDRVAAILPNVPETIISMLATTSLGAIWSSCSPDFGKEGLYDRFHQIQPKILIVCDGYNYAGKTFTSQEKIAWLCKQIPSIQKIILVVNTNDGFSLEATPFAAILSGPETTLEFEHPPFNHPVYIMYSSGTTGIPKCIVHGAGGTLLQHFKELALHSNVTQNDTLFYYTTCGWMMWNWYISSLGLGATVAQYDGAPFYPSPTRLLDFVDEEKITIFGTSAKYISALEKHNITPKLSHDLGSLQTILSTGSPLIPQNFTYIYENVKSNVCLSSISGGTDIISCFALGNPTLPVYRGELQCIGLGMAVKIFNDAGKSVINEKGELVCTNAFPSMPIYFWNDSNGEKYQQAYFNKFPGVWAHGDFAEITDRGTLIIYGRSDATLNPGGVRIGTAEIYRQVEKIPDIIESLAVGQEWKDDTRVILFVVTKENLPVTEELESDIKKTIREHCSARHVPAKIIKVPDIPKTINGKIVELAVRDVIHNRPVKNIASIANPECLEYFKTLIILE